MGTERERRRWGTAAAGVATAALALAAVAVIGPPLDGGRSFVFPPAAALLASVLTWSFTGGPRDPVMRALSAENRALERAFEVGCGMVPSPGRGKTEDAVRSLLDLLFDALRADRCVVWNADPERGLLVAWIRLGRASDGPAAAEIRPSEGAAGQAYTRRRALFMPARAALPLEVHGAVRGVLEVTRPGDRKFDSTEREILRLVAGRLAILTRYAQVVRRGDDHSQTTRILAEAVRQPVFALDPRLRIELMNEAMARRVHLPPDHARGKACTEVFVCRDAEGVTLCESRCPFKLHFAGGRAETREALVVHPKRGEPFAATARIGFTSQGPAGQGIALLEIADREG